MSHYSFSALLGAAFFLSAPTIAQVHQTTSPNLLLSQPIDVSADFTNFANTYFFADSLSDFNINSGEGKVKWGRYSLEPRQAFNTNGSWPIKLQMLDFPTPAYDNDPELDFKIDFVSERTFRIRMYTSNIHPDSQAEEVMLAGEVPSCDKWNKESIANGIKYSSQYGSITIERYPWRIVIKDANGKIIQQTRHVLDNDTTQVKSLPFCFIKRGADNSRSIAPMLSLAPNERIYGCGESFTALNKVGQKINMFVTDPQGPETDMMYKPVPFYMSNKGYGIFLHTSAPVTADFGATYIGTQKLFMADESLDMFVMLGSPKEILDEYTNLVGKPEMPPMWSFGTWMSRITYFSQEEGYEIARQLRENKIPADVIHFDTGWFGVDWQCDYKFASDRFSDPAKMVKDLKELGFHISLWQLPYFTPKNAYFNELVEKGLYVKNANGSLPYEDVVLDFTNPETVKWYQEKLAGLLKLGVGAIKVDFGEASPVTNGIYSNGRSGLYEHNVYTTRYDKAVYEITKATTGEGIIWSRSAWAGSQRYPLHWGGDAANTNAAMLSTLKGGLSIGLSGFSFWSHDIGGFVQSCPEELYRRWLPFGMFTSHSRVHGAPPTEPWLYNQDFVDYFRKVVEMKYKLMPYIADEAKACTEQGLPMMRALLVEFPEDPGAWMIEDQYMFGSQILVAPMFEEGTSRTVYLPGKTKWVDYQTGKVYNPGWNEVQVGEVPIVLMVRKGTKLKHVPVAQSIDKINWSKIKVTTY
ncbi:MAG: glycoside hydrolase family 31 protein [Bacteroidia bacterium]|nr:glycoside hydrolase family 31 protein [Bacteroidia bacterium]